MKIDELKEKGLEYWSKLTDFSKNSLGPLILLLLLDFNVVRQGLEIGTELTKSGFTGAQSKASEFLTRAVKLLGATVVSGYLMYWLGGNFLVIIHATLLIIFQLYVASVVFAASMAYQALRSESSGKPSVVLDVVKIFKHVLYWNCILLILILVIQPWESDRLQWFVILMLSELAWFVLSPFTRKSVRLASIVVSGVTGLIAFFILILPHIGFILSSDVQSKISQSKDNVINAAVIGMERATTRWVSSAKAIPKLPEEQRIIDLNLDDTLNRKDLKILKAIVGDSTLFSEIKIDERKFPRGDFNGDGQIDSADIKQFERFLEQKGPGPADMSIRQGTLVPVIRTASANMPSTPPVHASTSTKADQSPIEPPKPVVKDSGHTYNSVRTVRVGTPLSGTESYTIIVDQVEYTPELTIVTLTWSNPQSTQVRATVHKRTQIQFPQGKYYVFKVVGLDKKWNWIRSWKPQTAQLYFPALPTGTTYFDIIVHNYWTSSFKARIIV